MEICWKQLGKLALWYIEVFFIQLIYLHINYDILTNTCQPIFSTYNNIMDRLKLYVIEIIAENHIIVRSP